MKKEWITEDLLKNVWNGLLTNEHSLYNFQNIWRYWSKYSVIKNGVIYMSKDSYKEATTSFVHSEYAEAIHVIVKYFDLEIHNSDLQEIPIFSANKKLELERHMPNKPLPNNVCGMIIVESGGYSVLFAVYNNILYAIKLNVYGKIEQYIGISQPKLEWERLVWNYCTYFGENKPTILSKIVKSNRQFDDDGIIKMLPTLRGSAEYVVAHHRRSTKRETFDKAKLIFIKGGWRNGKTRRLDVCAF